MPNRAPTTPPGGPRILVCGWAGAGNVGDELLTRAVVAVLRDAGAHVVLTTRDPRATEIEHPGVEAIPWGPRGLRHLGRVDGVCLGPGGILQDNSSLWNLPGHLVMPAWARARGAAVASIGVGAEPLRRKTSAALLRRVLRGAAVVTRDAGSTAALTAAGIDATTSIDLVFGLAPPPPTRRDEIVVAVGPSTRPGRFAPASRRLVAAPIDEIAGAVDVLAARLGCRVVLARFRGERDRAAAEAVAARLVADHEILGPDVDEHVRRVTGARLVVASRYHPIVLAATTGTPTLAVSTQAKVVSLVAQIDHAGVVRADSWRDATAHAIEAEPGTPRIPAGLDTAHAALRELVRVAREPRGERHGG